MNTATPTATRKRTNAAATDAPRTLDTLHRMSFDALDTLYRSAPAPRTLAALDGRPQGRMLALSGTANGPLARAVRTLARSAVFPWKGKTFRSRSDSLGEGINRIGLLNLYRGDWFRFETGFEPSLIDGKPCVRLNYGLPQNPPGIRHIVDELREVAPGLFLGPAQLVFGRRPPLTVLYFAIAS